MAPTAIRVGIFKHAPIMKEAIPAIVSANVAIRPKPPQVQQLTFRDVLTLFILGVLGDFRCAAIRN